MIQSPRLTSVPSQRTGVPDQEPVEVCSVVIPTPYGEFLTRVFETAAGHPYLALVKGEVSGDEPVLARLHSECLTGDVLGSLRCDCGVQLRTALRRVAAEGRGVVLYLTGQEGRGIGLVNKLRAYVEQDFGADTVDANLRLGLPADRRDYADAASVLSAVGVRAVRLMSNNPAKADGLRAGGIKVETIEAIPTSAHHRNASYLSTKANRMGHVAPTGEELTELPNAPVDVHRLMGEVEPPPGRPYVVLSYAQTVDGRLAERPGDTVSHALRAASDAVLVGAGTVERDDPRLTVRLVAGASPTRVVLDPELRTAPAARVFADDAATTVYTAEGADAERMTALRASGIGVRTVPAGPDGTDPSLDLGAVLADLRAGGVRSVLVEGGGRVIAAMLAAGLVDRLVVAMAPSIGAGSAPVDVGPTGDALRLTNRCVYLAGDDVILAWDVER
jgi:GTP cyclohydrolase II